MNIYKLKILYFNKILVTIVLAMIFLVKVLCSANYSKSIDLNGIKASLTTDVVKRAVGKGVNVKEDNRFSNKEESTDETSANAEEEDIEYDNNINTDNKGRDEYVKVSLSIRNNNPYESANVTITEIVNRGFKQVDTNKLDRKISFKLESNKEKTYKYNYKYSKNTLLDQIDSIIYGDGSVEDIASDKTQVDIINSKDIGVNDKGIANLDISDKEKATIDEKEKKKDNLFKIILIVFIVIILGFTIFMLFLTFFQRIRDRDIDFGDRGNFNSFAIFIIFALLLSIIFKKHSYAIDYTPIMYQKGESFTKTIKETVLFNDRYFEFSYEISVKFDNKHEITNYDIDTDGDGLADALEYLYMTDINDKDSDGDGLSDYLEVMVMNYNPNSKWTFNDGRNDGYRDYDEDGLRNKKEIEIGTDPTLYDTDGDGLDDYEEVNGVLSKDGSSRYETDPLKADTDEDGLDDYVEIKLSLDPTKRMTDGVTLDAERKIEQEFPLTNISKELTNNTFPIIEVSGSIKGDIDKELSIKEYRNENLNNSDLVIGKPLSIELSNSNVNGKVSIKVDCSNYGERVKKLTFVRYENGIMEYVETEVDGNNIVAKLGRGNYAIVDAEQYLRKLNIYVGDY